MFQNERVKGIGTVVTPESRTETGKSTSPDESLELELGEMEL